MHTWPAMRRSVAAVALLALAGCALPEAAVARVTVHADDAVRARARTVELLVVRASDRGVARHEHVDLRRSGWPLSWELDADALGDRRLYVILRAYAAEDDDPVARQLLLAELIAGRETSYPLVLVANGGTW